MNDLDTAQALIESIQGQSSLLLTLSTALIGGAAALAVQLKIRDGEILPLHLNCYLVVGMILLGLSCILSWAVLGALIDKTPVIMSLQFNGQEFSKIKEIRESTALTLLANGQFLFFVIGTLLAAFGFVRLKR